MRKLSRNQKFAVGGGITLSSLLVAGILIFVFWDKESLGPEDLESKNGAISTVESRSNSKSTDLYSTTPLPELEADPKENSIPKFEQALSVPENSDNIKKLFDAAKEHHTELTTVEAVVREKFTQQKTLFLSLDFPSEDDLKKLKAMEDNLKSLVESYEAEKSLEQEFCDVYGANFTEPFEAVEADPSIEGAQELAQKANRFFPFARMFCKGLPGIMHHAYAYPSLEAFLVERIQSPETRNTYISILRFINPSSLWAFSDCPDEQAVNTKLPSVVAEQSRLTLECENTKFRKKILNILNLRQIETDVLSLMILFCDKLLEGTGLSALEINYVQLNRSLLVLVRLVKTDFASSEVAQEWLQAEFKVRETKEFRKFFKETPVNYSFILALREASNMFKQMAFIHEASNEYTKAEGSILSASAAGLLFHVARRFGTLTDQGYTLRIINLYESFVPPWKFDNSRGFIHFDYEEGIAAQIRLEILKSMCDEVIKVKSNHFQFFNKIARYKVEGLFQIETS